MSVSFLIGSMTGTELRSGRSLKFGKRGDREIVKVARTNRRVPLSELTCIVNQSLPQNISSRTVRRRFRFHRYTRPTMKKILTVSTINRKKTAKITSEFE